MAKALAFQRDTSQVVTIDTINNTLANLGAVIAGAETTSDFAGRTQNVVATFLGDTFFLYLDSGGSVNIQKYDAVGGTWSLVNGPIAPASGGDLKPVCLHVVNDQLVAVWHEIGGGAPQTSFTRSTNGTAWFPAVGNGTDPGAAVGGASVVWQLALWVSTPNGLLYIVPGTPVIGAVLDTGDDAGLTGQSVSVGSFTFWNNNLYFAKPDSGAGTSVYRLDPAWDDTAPAAPPQWVNQGVTGVPSVGPIAVGSETGTILLFVNRLSELCLAYSGPTGSKLLKTTVADFPVFSDISSLLPSAIVTETDLGFSIYVDDRRRTNELQSFVVRDTFPGDTFLLTWDGSSDFDFRTTFTGVVFMPSDEETGELRTFTDLQPTAHITAFAQPFPGRVRLDYVVRDSLSRKIDVLGEYTTDGDVWLSMTRGSGDSGNTALDSSPGGDAYFFFWDAFVDLDGSFDNMRMRIVARISGV